MDLSSSLALLQVSRVLNFAQSVSLALASAAQIDVDMAQRATARAIVRRVGAFFSKIVYSWG